MPASARAARAAVRAPPTRWSAGLAARAAPAPGGAAAAMQLSASRSQSSGSRGRVCAISCARCEPWIAHWVGQGVEVACRPFRPSAMACQSSGSRGRPTSFRQTTALNWVGQARAWCCTFLPSPACHCFYKSLPIPSPSLLRPLAAHPSHTVAVQHKGSARRPRKSALPFLLKFISLWSHRMHSTQPCVGRTAVAPESSAARSWAARAAAPAARRYTAPTCTRRSLPQR